MSVVYDPKTKRQRLQESLDRGHARRQRKRYIAEYTRTDSLGTNSGKWTPQRAFRWLWRAKLFCRSNESYYRHYRVVDRRK